jgi:hypothetical protein
MHTPEGTPDAVYLYTVQTRVQAAPQITALAAMLVHILSLFFIERDLLIFFGVKPHPTLQ